MVLALAACGTTEAPTAGTVTEPDSATEEVTEEPSTRIVEVNDLLIGDCWNPIDFTVDPSSGPEGVYSGVEVVSCERAHMAEVYAIFDLEGTRYPDQDDYMAQCKRGCLGGFEEFVGSEYLNSVLDINIVGPSQKSWNLKDDRTVVCSVIDMYGEELIGSMEGSER